MTRRHSDRRTAPRETAVNINRLCTASAALAACGVLLTGCGAGQISQSAGMEAAINGAAANAGDIGLRNIHLQAVQTEDFLRPGDTVPLMFVAVNNSPDENHQLVRITSDVGQVSLTGDGTIPASGALVVGLADGQPQTLPDGEGTPAIAEVKLTKPITNGLSYGFTFDFGKAGTTTVAVPISAGNADRRE